MNRCEIDIATIVDHYFPNTTIGPREEDIICEIKGSLPGLLAHFKFKRIAEIMRTISG